MIEMMTRPEHAHVPSESDTGNISGSDVRRHRVTANRAGKNGPAGVQRVKRLVGLVPALLGAGVLVAALTACEPPANAARPKASTNSISADSFTVPDFTAASDYQVAQEQARAVGLKVRPAIDGLGKDRIPVVDDNWVVVSQDIPAGGRIRLGASVTMTVVKADELAQLNATPTPTPTVTPKPPVTPKPTATPKPSVTPKPTAPTRTPAPAAAPVVVLDVVDGDTIETTVGTVRLIGIDTPEVGECNYEAATNELRGAIQANGNQVVLLTGKTEDKDKYGRLLRYVDTVDGVDLNGHMVTTGLAIARYDSRDGYGWHPRESAYIAADAANNAPGCEVTPTPQPTPVTPVPPVAPVEPEPQQPTSGEPWNQPGPDLDCADIGHVVFITGTDYHKLDRDGDGVGCESYG